MPSCGVVAVELVDFAPQRARPLAELAEELVDLFRHRVTRPEVERVSARGARARVGVREERVERLHDLVEVIEDRAFPAVVVVTGRREERRAIHLLAIDGLYKTAEDMDSRLRGQAVQFWLEGDAIVAEALN